MDTTNGNDVTRGWGESGVLSTGLGVIMGSVIDGVVVISECMEAMVFAVVGGCMREFVVPKGWVTTGI